jgi:hypothetical protein
MMHVLCYANLSITHTRPQTLINTTARCVSQSTTHLTAAAAAVIAAAAAVAAVSKH